MSSVGISVCIGVDVIWWMRPRAVCLQIKLQKSLPREEAMACVALQSVPPNSPHHRWLSMSPGTLSSLYQTSSIKQSSIPAVGKVGAPLLERSCCGGRNWLPCWGTKSGISEPAGCHSGWPMFLRDCQVPLQLSGSLPFPFPSWKHKQCCSTQSCPAAFLSQALLLTGLGQGSSCFSCSVNAQLLQPTAAKTPPLPLWRLEILLCWQLTGQTKQLICSLKL